MNNRLQTYRETDTLGKAQIDLILQVYDGAIAAFSSARDSYAKKNYDSGYTDLEKAKRFLTHLYTTLDFEQGGEVANNLGQLYAYMINQTNVVEASKDVGGIDSNLKILQNLRQGWSDIKSRTASAAGPPEPAETAPAVPQAQVNASA